jgi:hypothetical protein
MISTSDLNKKAKTALRSKCTGTAFALAKEQLHELFKMGENLRHAQEIRTLVKAMRDISTILAILVRKIDFRTGLGGRSLRPTSLIQQEE